MPDPAMAAPTLVQQNEGILVSWLVYTTWTPDGYVLTRHDTTADVTITIPVLGGATTSYFDTDLISGHNYCYSVKAQYTSGAPTMPHAGPFNLPINVPWAASPYLGSTGAPTFSSPDEPTGISINSAGVFSGTPTVAGAHTTNVTATNGFGTDTDVVQFHIYDPLNVPDVGPYNLIQDVPFARDDYTGFTTGEPTFSAVNLPPGIEINPATGEFTGAATWWGFYSATVTASNPLQSVNKTVDFDVQPWGK